MNFGEERFKRHDPKQVVENHCRSIKYICLYKHEEWDDDKILWGASSYEEVFEKNQEKKKEREEHIKRK